MVERGEGRAWPVSVASASYNQYPAPLAKYEDVVANHQLFMTTLEKLHSAMGTKFMIPIIGGRDLDLHKLFLEVTSRGGIEKILREKRWKDVTATFNFPSTATNASFVLRKYYYSLLQHYEQIYYFRAQGWTPSPNSALQSPHSIPAAAHGFLNPAPTQVESIQQPRINTVEFVNGAGTASSVGSPVIGLIDGKFESGYLITVTIGKEKLKGVLYQAPPILNPSSQMLQTSGKKPEVTGMTTASVHHSRRRRRRKSEIRKRDPAHPKPNRSGYNFFFAEQHARLKPLYPGKDREISRMIGELWNKLKDNEKAVYQDKAIRDKERYRMEMEGYRERIRANQATSDAVPTQQRFPHLNVKAEAKASTGNPPLDENESDSSRSESEEEDEDYENYSETEASLAISGGTINVGGYEASTSAAGDFQVVQGDDKGCLESQGSLGIPGEHRHQHHNSITSMT